MAAIRPQAFSCSSPGRPAFSMSWRLTARFLLIFSVLAPIFVHAATQVVIGELATRDPSRPIYRVSVPDLGGNVGPAGKPQGEIIRMVTARGQAMLCGVPTLAQESKSDDKDRAESEARSQSSKEEERLDAEAEDTSFQQVDALLAEYKDKCFQRSEGWWSYIFCYGSSVEQKHIALSKDEEEVSYVLGVFDPAHDIERRKRPKDIGTSDAPFTQLYGNGTVCDVSGKPREILVKYKCNQEALQIGGTPFGTDLNVISAVREVETCVYEIDFVNSGVCRHPAYRNKIEKNALSINCIMENEEDTFQGLTSLSYRKSSLNL